MRVLERAPLFQSVADPDLPRDRSRFWCRARGVSRSSAKRPRLAPGAMQNLDRFLDRAEIRPVVL